MKKKFYVLALLLLSSFFATLYGVVIDKPNTFTSGEVISASQMNENFDVVYEQVNKISQRTGFAVAFPSGQTYTIVAGNYTDFRPSATMIYNDGNFNTSTFTYTIPEDGFYRLTEGVSFSGLTMVNIKRFKNSTPWASIDKMSAGDTIRWEVGSNSDNGMATLNDTSFIYLERLF